MRKPDFRGWATRNGLRCSDGRIIGKDAFKDQDGQSVTMVWQHRHDDPDYVIGHAILHNAPQGVIADCYLNNSEKGASTKELVKNGDVVALSINANDLIHRGAEVVHGVIREVSVVLSPANPGALIMPTTITHSSDGEEIIKEAEIFTGMPLIEDDEVISHSSDENDVDNADANDNTLSHSSDEKKEESEDEKKPKTDEEKSVKDVLDTMSDEQRHAVDILVGGIIAEYQQKNSETDDEEDSEEEKEMKHNVFESKSPNAQNTLSHADQATVLQMAKEPGMTFQTALKTFAGDNGIELQHDAISSGFVQDTSQNGNVSWLFPEYKDLGPAAPELLTNDQGWITTVLDKVHKSPISRIRTRFVDIRNIEGAHDDLRARGYQKGKEKQLTGNFKLVRRTTDPQTIYVKSQLHRDDIIDITDFDYVQYLYNIDRMQLNEELAMAIMLGDFRQDNDADKIFPEHIRPIWTDDDLYTMHRDFDVADARARLQGNQTGSFFGDNYVYAEGLIEQCLYAREKFKGSGTPDFYMTPHMLNVMLLSRDRNGRRIFGSKAELASALNVNSIVTAEQFADRVRTDSKNAQHKLLGLIVNLADYSLGHTKGGEITHFTQFDIDFNMQKSLLETRCSGALTRVYSAIAIEEPVTAGGTQEPEEP